ncbi:hypothetical protein [Psychrobacter sp. H8-1]|uniref:hypothetical protein n=1 Tax=Psychrobacter sp. H8-1 TaxID=2774129 RepID=UPI001D12DADC|nr:hypothetical protein [Psychrobacter sp. H8-1]
MSQLPILLRLISLLLHSSAKVGLALFIMLAAITGQAAPTVITNDPATETAATDTTFASQMQPSSKALSDANQELLSRNAQLQRQVNDLQTQVNVLIYESKGQLFLYGAFTVLISLLVGVFISWLVFVRRERW